MKKKRLSVLKRKNYVDGIPSFQITLTDFHSYYENLRVFPKQNSNIITTSKEII